MKLSVLFVSILTSLFCLAAHAEAKKTTTLVNGETFHFTVTNKDVDCNGTGFVGADLELLAHDKKNKVKVYNINPEYGLVTLMWCDTEHKSLVERTKSYQSKADETVVFILNNGISLVVE